MSGATGALRPIRRLAIANRGEAALRCIRAARSLGARENVPLQTIALYTEVDRDAPFVRHADVAIELPSPNGAVAAYLDHDAVIGACREARADAVWPGWGFVAEDPDFTDRVAAEGMIFLGPSGDAMRMLGDKIAAKKLAESSGVPVTAWSGGEVETEDDASAQAEAIGYPVVIKASAGGGGRGIRLVHQAFEVKEAFRAARAEAESAFGDNRVFCEKLVEGGRHIEVQIVADEHGHAFAVGSRDCSVPRRHQKVLEEAPPPNLSPEVLEPVTAAAVQLAQRVGYVGVGTVEFLLSGSVAYFLEINPRLQVEHGITEEITGLDLV